MLPILTNLLSQNQRKESAIARRFLIAALLAVLVAFGGCDLPNFEDTDDDVGLDALRRRMGASQAPTGKGVRLSLVEANSAEDADADQGPPLQYVPDRTRAGLQDKTITDQSGQTHPPQATSGHATGMARLVCGKGGIAPGVQEIDAYLSSHWLLEGPLQGFRPQPPKKMSARLMNHSWVAVEVLDDKESGIKGEQIAAEYLRRADLLIDRDGLTMVVGVNNRRDTMLPHLFAHAYNVISVGLSSGNSSVGPTRIESEVAGRCKPDIVCPARTTSAATAKVTGAAALLLETADAHAHAAHAARPEVIKAVLLAGATRDEEEFDEPWPDDVAQPLDFHRGAGELNINNSHLILSAERRGPGSEQPASSTGWDYGEVASGETRRYRLHLPPGQKNEVLSISLVWHRKIAIGTFGDDHPAIVAPAPLANLNLRLVHLDKSGEETLVAESASQIDNVEHLFIAHPAPGDYFIEVNGASGSAPFAVAWQTRGADEPMLSVGVQYALRYLALLLAAIVFYVWRKRRARRADGAATSSNKL